MQFVFAVTVILMVGACSADQEKVMKELKKIFETCADENQVTEDDMKVIFKNDTAEIPHNAACFATCAFEKVGGEVRNNSLSVPVFEFDEATENDEDSDADKNQKFYKNLEECLDDIVFDDNKDKKCAVGHE